MIFTPIKPMLLCMGKEVTNNPGKLYDIKWDGWRILLHKQGNRIEAFTRHGNNVTFLFHELDKVKENIKADTAILDCEGVVLRKGISNFNDFSYRGLLRNKQKIVDATETHPVSFIAFDIIQTNKTHMKEPLIDRKRRLQEILTPSNVISPTPFILENGKDIYKLTKEQGMEGIVEKSIQSVYKLNTRSSSWLKHKHFKYMDAVIMGYKENPFCLIVGAVFSGKIKPIATVKYGYTSEDKKAFRSVSRGIITKEENGVTWVEPLLCCNIKYLERNENDRLRITSFNGFKLDKQAIECGWN